ncbi:ribonuclease H-like domain, reverse transcriptase, RNA-dependent DNA polymerase [Tanacetum coccineum]
MLPLAFNLVEQTDGTRNNANLLKEVVLPYVDEHVAMEVHSPLVEQTNAVKSGGESYPPLPTQGTTPTRNIPGKRVAYPVVDNYVRNTWGKFGLSSNYSHKVEPGCEFIKRRCWECSCLGETSWFPIMAFSEDGLSAIATKLGTPIMLDSYTTDMCLQSWGRSSYARVMIELRADVELKDTIVVAMPKINKEGFYTCNVRVEYEWKPPRCVCCKIFSHTQVECPKNPGLGARASETKKKKSSQAPKVPISVDNDVEMGTNEGTSNLDKNGANSSRSSFWNLENSSTSTTPIKDKFGKFENLIIDGQAIRVDEADNPLKKVEYLDDHDSEDEVA